MKRIVLLLLIICFMLPQAVYGAGGKDDSTNIMCVWTDEQEIKALTIMTFNSVSGRVGILTIPIFTTLEVQGRSITVGQIWKLQGRDKLKKYLESQLATKIHGHITFDQPVVVKASTVVGPFEVKGQNTTLLQAFEDTRTERRKDDQDVVRAMAASIISPSGIKKVPQLLWIFTTQVDTDIRPEQMLKIYRVVSKNGPTILTKRALRGQDYYSKGIRYRYVEPATWKSIMSEINTVSSLCHSNQQAKDTTD